MKRLCFLLAFPMFCLSMWGQASSSSPYKAQVRGTLRTKWEYQTEEKTQRFQMRNARVGIEGKTSPYLSYKAEADLSDEGQLKIIDIWGEVQGNLRRGHDLRLRPVSFVYPSAWKLTARPTNVFLPIVLSWPNTWSITETSGSWDNGKNIMVPPKRGW